MLTNCDTVHLSLPVRRSTGNLLEVSSSYTEIINQRYIPPTLVDLTPTVGKPLTPWNPYHVEKSNQGVLFFGFFY